MADDESSSDDARLAAERRRRRPAPTIELTATEVASEPSQASSHASAQASSSTMGSEQPDRRTDAGASPRRPVAFELPFGLTWPLVGAVGIGAGAAVVLVLGVLALAGALGGRSEDPALASRLGTMETQLKSIAERRPVTTIDPRTIDDFAARLAKAEQTIASPRAADPALAARLDAAETATKVLMDSVASLNRRSDDAAALLREIRERVDAMAKTSAAGGADHAQVEQLAGRIAALERAGKTIETELRNENATSDRAVRLAVSTAALKSAVERGAPFTTELAAVRPLIDAKMVDAKALEPLSAFVSSGVPSAASLAQELTSLVPALVRANAPPPTQDGGLLDRLQAGASRLVKVRPVDEAPGDDPAAVIARIEGKAKRADIAGALDDLARMPANLRAPAEAWIKKAQARAAALDAAQKIAADAFAALSKPAQ